MKLLPLIAALSVVSSALGAAEPAAPVFDFDGMTCRELLQSSGAERDLLLAMHHGYHAGKAGISKPEIAKLTEATDKVVDFCIDNPAKTISASFKAAHGGD